MCVYIYIYTHVTYTLYEYSMIVYTLYQTNSIQTVTNSLYSIVWYGIAWYIVLCYAAMLNYIESYSML